MASPTINVLRAGDLLKTNPYTICIVANPALEAPWNSGQFIPDPILQMQSLFDQCAAYIDSALYGNLPGQQEKLLANPAIAAKIRIVTVFVPDATATSANSLVGQDSISELIVARRTSFALFLGQFGIKADVAYAVTNSASHTRASAWFTTDDDGGQGIPFTVDAVAFSHRFNCLIPGTVAIHASATSLTALHEFGHAASSYSNGSIVDLYVDSGPGLNCRQGRPIPLTFADFNGAALASDPNRDGLGYPPGWQSYHCALNDATKPAVMDNYWQTAVSESCQHDEITRRFLLDRITAKVGR